MLVLQNVVDCYHVENNSVPPRNLSKYEIPEVVVNLNMVIVVSVVHDRTVHILILVFNCILFHDHDPDHKLLSLLDYTSWKNTLSIDAIRCVTHILHYCHDLVFLVCCRIHLDHDYIFNRFLIILIQKQPLLSLFGLLSLLFKLLVESKISLS